jgi:hypothetical protein
MRSGLPDMPDLFDRGDLVTAHAAGGTLGPLRLSTPGVAPLETLEDGVVHVRAGQPTNAGWQPADPDSHMMVLD